MTVRGITLEDVRTVKSLLEGRGERATPNKVRKELGDKGSYTTIDRHLKTLKAEAPPDIGRKTEIPKDIVDAMSESVEKIWDEAVHLAAADVGEIRKVCAERVEALELELKDALDALESMEKELDVYQEQVEAHSNEIEALKKITIEYEVKLAQCEREDEGRAERLENALARLSEMVLALSGKDSKQ
ncbi:MAG: DNA-binding protein [Thiogranum sp.]|nr:DNA-binding protein [Thiogranum sp.]